MAGKVTSAEHRALRPERRVCREAKRSTNGAVGLQYGASERQTRARSLAEACTNVIAGYLMALLAQQIILPLFGIHVGLAAHAGIAALFTLLSLMRSYLVRRLFEHLAWQRREDERLRRERLERRLAGRP